MSAAGETVGRDLEIPLPPRRRIYLRIEELPDPEDARGRRVLLAKPSAYVLQLAQRADALSLATPEGIAALYDLAAALMPELPREDVEKVSPETIHYVMDVFQQPIAKLEELAKNGVAPLAEAQKGSSSLTPSPTRSRRSRRATGSGSGT